MNTYYTTSNGNRANFYTNSTTNGWYSLNAQWVSVPVTRITYKDNESAAHLLRQHDPYEADSERSKRLLREATYTA